MCNLNRHVAPSKKKLEIFILFKSVNDANSLHTFQALQKNVKDMRIDFIGKLSIQAQSYQLELF